MNSIQQEDREVIYQILSSLFYKPTEDSLQSLEILQEIFFETDQDLYLLASTLLKESKKKNIDSLTLDFGRLFVGSSRPLASPYASIYLEGKWEVMGQSTIDTLQYYKEAGLEIKEGFHELPDHIAVELEFIYYLIYKYLEEKDEKYLLSQQKFVEKILNKWVPSFTKLIKEHAETDYYKFIGTLLEKWVEKDAKELQKIPL
ncbi:TorD/DmsD family molecular chaperone [Schinkia azotoformans]|uniref:TorD/DmsD family molecular chaperone n=1 Tax=Schinkia azotoformans TaxID=1454 RepID=UPI002DB75319|nr:molecular chaperone TorD family protein [Schinkia azotoformans]MEC1718930.1 molecular chaperone TorD family protein [Schinkia azotoformans]MED4412858.1 molecular chaperone TorD family protein [Schinkia azotoformans]